MAGLDWITESLRAYFPNADICVTSNSIGITATANGERQWYGRLIKMPSEEDHQPFIDDVVKWFENRFGEKS